MFGRPGDKKEKDGKQKSGRTVTGQVVSFFGGGAIGSFAYNAYHAVKNKSQEPSSLKSKR